MIDIIKKLKIGQELSFKPTLSRLYITVNNGISETYGSVDMNVLLEERMDVINRIIDLCLYNNGRNFDDV